MNLAEKYINDVTKNKVLTGRYVKLAVQRHINDLKKSRRKNYPYKFDKVLGQRAIEICKIHRHTKGEKAGQFFDLQPFQAFVLWVLFGWIKKENHQRRFTKVYKEIARKNGKTEFAAVIANICFLFDGEAGAEIYSAATKRPQAKIVFERSKTMLRYLKKDSPAINKLVGIHQHNLHVLSTSSKYEALSADSNTEDGLSPSCAIVDEYHAHKSSDLLKVIETGQGSRLQPLLFIITTAGFNNKSPCALFRKVCVDILEGRKEDENIFCIIFSLDTGDNWKNEKLWIKANPNIGNSPYWDYMRSQFRKALNEGVTAEIQFKTKNLNIWTNTHSPWIQDDKIQAAGSLFDLAPLKGRECYAGLDLSSIRDITALSLVFPPTEKGEKIKTISFFWCPEDGAKQRAKSDGVPYLQWERDGFLTFTKGNVVDYNYIQAKILELLEIYSIKLILYDRWNATQPILELAKEGVAGLHPFGQGFASMNAPTNNLEKLILKKEIDLRQNPVLRWMFSNVALKMDPAGNIKVDKSKSSEKVDGVVSLIMALAGLMNDKNETSVYEERGVRSV